MQNNQKLNLSDNKLNRTSKDNSQVGSVPEGYLTSSGERGGEEEGGEEKARLPSDANGHFSKNKAGEGINIY